MMPRRLDKRAVSKQRLHWTARWQSVIKAGIDMHEWAKRGGYERQVRGTERILEALKELDDSD